MCSLVKNVDKILHAVLLLSVVFSSTYMYVYVSTAWMVFVLFHIVTDWFIWFFDAAIGFNVETVQYNNIKFQVWDLGNDHDSASSV